MRAVALSLGLALVGCTPSGEGACEAFVDAWAAYQLRCGTYLAPPMDRPVEDHDRELVEVELFGSEQGCEATSLDDLRDPQALAQDCPVDLEEWPCEQPSLPASCADQIGH